jgi:hypothetical protein
LHQIQWWWKILSKVFWLRLQELYKRFIKTWIRIVSWSQILTPKRFNPCLTKQILDLYRIMDHESWLKKICFESLIRNPVNFQRFSLFSWIQWILTNLHKSLVL